MQLRGKKPELIQKRLKLLMYGSASTGKTTAALSFPAPYLIDTERGAEHSQYKELLEKQGGVIFQSDDYEEILSEIRALLYTQHNYKTLIIDPITPVWANILESAEKELGTAYQRHFVKANKVIKNLVTMLYKLDMNVILTAHSKDVYEKNGGVVGQTYDAYKKLDYIFDLVIEIKKDKGSRDRIAKVIKTRLSTFTEDEEFVFKYLTLADRYGKDIIEKETSASTISLITEQQKNELGNLLVNNGITEDKINEMLEKCGASKIEDMDSDYANRCIERLAKLYNNKKKSISEADQYV